MANCIVSVLVLCTMIIKLILKQVVSGRPDSPVSLLVKTATLKWNKRSWCDWPLLKSTQTHKKCFPHQPCLLAPSLTWAEPVVLESSVLLCILFWRYPMCQKKININMALMIVTSVPNSLLMIGPFLLSVGDQWYIVMTENPLSLTPNGHCGRIHYSITAPVIHCEFIKRFPLYPPLYKLLSRMAGRGTACQCLHVNIPSYLWVTKKEAQVKM